MDVFPHITCTLTFFELCLFNVFLTVLVFVARIFYTDEFITFRDVMIALIFKSDTMIK